VLAARSLVDVLRQLQRDGHDLLIDLLIRVPPTGMGLTDQTLGSSDIHLLRKSPCPVWIDRPRSAHPCRPLLAAADPTDPHEDVLSSTRTSVLALKPPGFASQVALI
jgi:hypothetical protein